MYDIIFYEAFQEEQNLLKTFLPSSLKAAFYSDTIQKVNEQAPAGKIICIRTQSIIPKGWHDKIDAVLTRSQGYDHLLRMFKNIENPPKLGYLGPYCSRAVAEHAILSMLVLVRKLKSQMNGFSTFNREGLTGLELSGRKVLVAGVGEIGAHIVDLAKSLNMDVKAVDIEPQKEDTEYIDLKEGIHWAEIVFCALPLTDDTAGYFSYKLFKLSKKKPYFINISRGEISPFEDLVKLLDEKILSGVGLDVYQDESTVAEELRKGTTHSDYAKKLIDFSRRDDVVCTPHNAFNTREALKEKANVTIQSLLAYLKTGQFPYSVLSP
ncbi:MAG: hydroxyacid dehydrogenase [Candidatus Omnitrophica bacterium]|nr:hydroxyacid dehydrogenase [Candidatus Omnitrophota bacterium]